MNTRQQETFFHVAVWLLGCHLAFVSFLTAGSIFSAIFGAPLVVNRERFSLLCSLRLAILLNLPFFLFCRYKHYWLFNLRVHGAQQAPVYVSQDRILGRDHSRDIQAALKEHRFTDMLGEYFDRAGPTHWVRLFHTWVLQTRDHEIMKAMYGTQNADWDIGGARQASTAVALGRHSIFAINGPEWRHTRAMMRPTFVRNQIADLECTDRHAENFLRRLPRDGTDCVDVQELLYMFTMDISTDFMFGHSTDTLMNPTEESAEFSRSFDLLLLTAATQSRVGWFGSFRKDRNADRIIKTCNDFVDAHIANAKKNEKRQERAYVFMNELIDSGASPEEIRSQLLSMIVGGRDTSASVLTSMLWVLARRSDIVVKIRQELADLNGQKPTWDQLRNLKYLNNVLKETLRLYAPVTTNSRVANKDTVLPRGGGEDGQSPLFVPKGTTCRFSTYHIHRDEGFYGKDVNEFRPERWDTLRPKWEYVPFAGGPRICIGQQFALAQMLYLATRLFQTFSSIEAGDDKPMVQQVGTTIHLVNGCLVRLKPQ
ncbi:hypothetical protein NLG97_g3578 [Lecanicillium saksenae]|uniref:Uncharacterized protein n=1 Tax=Lecanicillium saksenae TaxID=468837 RepID=A0ACC1QXN4_9HYPO|nr:hypothetical protein NLG97_g3578 [Lecanicillium saksenae]